MPHNVAFFSSKFCRRCCSPPMLALFLLLGNAASADESGAPQIDPRSLGFDFPAGQLVAGAGRRVTASDDEGNPVVAKIHVEVGDNRILLLPDGQLVARSKAKAPDTDRPFEPISKDEIQARLLRKLPGFSFMSSGRYLFAYNTSADFVKTTSRIMQSMYRGVELHASAQKIKTHAPEVPLVVLMFRTEAEFQQYQRMPAGVVAYYNTLTNEVVLYEESPLAALSVELALGQKISTIAHEGAHQILHNIGVQQRLSIWPMWLSEGLAEYYAPTSFGARLTWKGAGDVNDMRMYELEEYLKGNAANGLDGKTIQQTVMAARLTSTGYASAWSLTHFLASKDRAEFNAYVNRMSQLGPLEGYLPAGGARLIEDNLTIFKEFFGDDLVGLEERQLKHLQKLPYTSPFAALPHYVVTVSYPDGRRVNRDANLFHSPEGAQRWQSETLLKVPDDQRGAAQTQVVRFQNRDLADRYRVRWLSGN